MSISTQKNYLGHNKKTLRPFLQIGIVSLVTFAWLGQSPIISAFSTGPGPRLDSRLLADNMSSESYELQLGNFNMTSGEKSSSGYTVTDTVGQTAAGEFNSTGYTVYAGFQYLYALSEFSFRIDDLNIDLGELQPNIFSSGSNQLIISTRSGGYSILAAATRPLEVKENPAYSISFTSCDAGCTISTAAPWTAASNPGFGFNVAGLHAASDFTNTTYFRPFADLSNSQSAQAIASATSKVTDDTLDVTYKATIPADQASGNYETSIEFLAVPSY